MINNIVGQTRGVKSEAKLRLTHKPPGDRFQAPPLLFGELLFQASLRMMSTCPPPRPIFTLQIPNESLLGNNCYPVEKTGRRRFDLAFDSEGTTD